MQSDLLPCFIPICLEYIMWFCNAFIILLCELAAPRAGGLSRQVLRGRSSQRADVFVSRSLRLWLTELSTFFPTTPSPPHPASHPAQGKNMLFVPFESSLNFIEGRLWWFLLFNYTCNSDIPVVQIPGLYQRVGGSNPRHTSQFYHLRALVKPW